MIVPDADAGELTPFSKNELRDGDLRYVGQGQCVFCGLDRIMRETMEAFVVTAEAPRRVMSERSGGNQRKMVLGKWFELDSKQALMDEPTQGVDVGVQRDVYDQLQAVSGAGGTVICAKSAFEQREIIAHRVLIFDRGRIVSGRKDRGL